MKNSLFTFLAIAVMFMLLTSCEGMRYAQGTVIDATNMQPLDSVLVVVETGSMSVYTDSTGKFEVSNNMSGCLSKCPDIHIRLSKPGYQDVFLVNPDSMGVFMEKQ